MRRQARPHVAEGSEARAEWRTIRTLLPYVWPRGDWDLRSRMLGAFVLLAAAKGTTVYVPMLYKQAVDALTKGVNPVVVVPIALVVGYGVLRCLAQAFAELRDALFAKVAQRAIRNVALEVFRHLHALSLAFHLDRQTGGLSRAIERGTKGIDGLLHYLIFNIVPTLIEIGLVGIVLWSLYGFAYAAVTLATIGGYIAFTQVVTEWRTQYRRTMNAMDTEANAKAIDSLINYETVKYFTNERHEERRFDVALKAYETAATRSKTSLSLLNVGQGVIIGVGLVTIMLMAGNGVAAGTMTVGDFVLVNTYLIQLYLPLNFLGMVYREVKQSLVDMEQMFRLGAVEPDVQDKPGAPALHVARGEVAFEGVAFAYRPDRAILQDVSFTVAPGRSLAIVGPSGAGKSTIARLLFRFYDVTGGAIRIDGHDIRDVTQTSVRAAIGIVPQDTVLFNDTVRYNIAYGRPDASDAEIAEAARLARLDALLASLPEGLETRVGERGLKLSGGEKQRVAIARTILKAPSILLFDEATSALDTQTERAIQASLKEVSAHRTTLIIAHRLSTVVDADEIVVLDAGRIAERGRHAELLARGGLYAAMWRRQQEAEGAAAD